MVDKQSMLPYKEALRRLAEQGKVDVLTQELRALKKERRYLPVSEPLIVDVKELVEVAKERQRDTLHHKARIQMSVEEDQEERERVHRQQEEEEEQIKKLRKVRRECLLIAEEIQQSFSLKETRAERKEAFMGNEETKDYISELMDKLNSANGDDEQVVDDQVVEELFEGADEAAEEVYAFLSTTDRLKPELTLSEVLLLALDVYEERYDDVIKPRLNPAPRPDKIFIVPKSLRETEEVLDLSKKMVIAGVISMIVPFEQLAVNKEEGQKKWASDLLSLVLGTIHDPESTPRLVPPIGNR